MASAAAHRHTVQNDVLQGGQREGGGFTRIRRRRDDEARPACISDVAVRRADLREEILLLDGSLVYDDGSGDRDIACQCLETLRMAAFPAVVVNIQHDIVIRILLQFDDGSGGALFVVDERQRQGVMPFRFRGLFVAQRRLQFTFDFGLQIVAIDGADRVAWDDFEIRLLFDSGWIVAFEELRIRHDAGDAIVGGAGGGAQKELDGIRVS